LGYLEDKLRPPDAPRPWARDLFGAGLIVALGCILLPAWGIDGQSYLSDVAGQAASMYLLPAMGFLLALRCGAVDLSVWSLSAAGGLIAASLINRHVPAALAFAAASFVGAAVGAASGLLVARLRVPSVVVTLAVAFGVVFVCRGAVEARDLVVSGDVFETLPAETGLPRETLAMLAVVSVWAAVLVVMTVLSEIALTRPGFGRRWRLAGALCASGALAATGGACWLMNHSTTPVPISPIGDLRVPAAAILAGGLFLTGRNRALLAGILLPAALLMVTIWRHYWPVQMGGISWQTAALIVMVLAAHAAMGRLASTPSRRPLTAVASVVLTAAGLLVVAAAGLRAEYVLRDAFRAAGAGLWFAGALLFAWLVVSDKSRTARQPSA